MEKALENQSQVLHLSGFKLTSVPNFTPSIDDFQFIRELNLAKNNLFNGEEVFQVKISIFNDREELFLLSFLPIGIKKFRWVIKAQPIKQLSEWYAAKCYWSLSSTRRIEFGC